MSTLPRATSDDRAEIAYSGLCLPSGAITLEALKASAKHAVNDTPSNALPPCITDGVIIDDRHEIVADLPDMAGIVPDDPALDVVGRHLADHAFFATRFAETFPFLTLPEVA